MQKQRFCKKSCFIIVNYIEIVKINSKENEWEKKNEIKKETTRKLIEGSITLLSIISFKTS